MVRHISYMRTNLGPGISAGVAGAPEGEYAFTVKELFRTIMKRIWMLVLLVCTCVGLGVALGLLTTPVYEARVKILVGQEEQATSVPGSLGGEVQGLQQITQTMAEGVNSDPIAEAVIRRLTLQTTPEDLLKNTSARPVRDTQFIVISHRDTSPERAQLVTNALGEEFSEQISEVSPSANAITATVWTPAKVPKVPVKPNLALNVVVALIIGLMLGLGVILLLEYVDDSLRSLEEAEEISGLRAFGAIPQIQSVEKGKKGVK